MRDTDLISEVEENSAWTKWKDGASRCFQNWVKMGGIRSHSLTLLAFTIEFLQLLALVFPTHMGTGWTRTGMLETVLKPFGVSFMRESFDHGNPAWFITALIIFLIVLFFNVFFVFSELQEDKERHRIYSLAFRFTNVALTRVLFVPLFGAFVAYGASLNAKGEEHSLSGGSGAYVSLVPFTLAALFLAVTTFFVMIDHEPFATSNALLRREQTHVDFVFHIARALAVVTASAVSSMTLYALLMTACAAGALSQLIWFPPYIVWKYNRIRAFVFVSWFWTALALLIQQIFHTNDLLVYTGWPMVILLADLLLARRRLIVSNLHPKDMRHPLEMAMKVRFFLNEAQQKCRSEMKTQQGLDESVLLKEELDTVEEWWAEGAKFIRMAESSKYHTMWALYQVSFERNIQLGLKLLNNATNMMPRFDEKFLIARLRSYSEERLTGGSSAVQAYLQYQSFREEARRNDARASDRTTQLWACLLAKSPDLLQLHRLGAEVNEAIDAASKNFERMLELNSNRPQDLRMYAGFLAEMRHETEEANAMLKLADSEELQQSKRHVSVHDNTIDIFDDRVAVVCISGDAESLGTIESFSTGASRMFGHSKVEVLDRDTSMLIPAPFAAKHNQFLQRYIETGHGSIMDTTNRMFGLHKSGHIFPMLLRVHQIMGDGSHVQFVGMMKAMPANESKFMLLDPSGIVQHWSSGTESYFPRLNQAKSQASAVHVSSILHDFEKNEKAMLTEMGYETLTSVDGEDFALVVQLKDMVFSGELLARMVCMTWKRLSADELLRMTGNGEQRTNAILSGDLSSEEGSVKQDRRNHAWGGDWKKEETDFAPSEAASRASRHSKASKGSRASRRSHTMASSLRSKTSVGALRRSIFSRNMGSNSSLARLKVIFLATVFLVVLALVCSYVVSHTQLEKYKEEMHFVENGFDRSLSYVWIATAVQQLSLHQTGMQPLDAATLEAFHVAIHDTADELDELERDIYFDGETLTGEHKDLYEIPSIPVYELHHGTVRTQMLNLHDALTLVTAKARQIYYDEDYDPTNSDVFFFHNTTIGSYEKVATHIEAPLLDALNKSTWMYYENSAASATSIQNMELIFMVCSLTILVFVLAVVFIPAVNRVVNNKTQVLSMFLDVPRSDVAKLHEKAQERMKRLNDLSGNKNLELSTEFEEKTDAETPEAGKATVELKQKVGTKSTSHQKRETMILYGKISLILVLCVPYFATIFWWSFSVVEQSKQSSYEVYWATRRHSTVRQQLYFMNEFVHNTLEGRSDEAELDSKQAIWLTEKMKDLHRRLLYGDTKYGFRSAIMSDPVQQQIWFVDGCMVIEGIGNHEGCATFANGLLENGAAPALAEYSNVIQNVVSLPPAEVRFNLSDVAMANELGLYHVDNNVEISELQYTVESDARLLFFDETRLYLLLGMIGALAVLYLVVYAPLIRQLRRGTHRTRAMLLVIPPSVMESTKTIRNFLTEQAKNL